MEGLFIAIAIPLFGILSLLIIFRLIEGRWPEFIERPFRKKYRYKHKGVNVKLSKVGLNEDDELLYDIQLKFGKLKWKKRIYADVEEIENEILRVVNGFLQRIENKKRSKEEEEWKLRTLFDEEIPDKEEEGSA